MDNYNYPMGADTKDAPWNQEENPEREIEVTVSVTLSKTVKIKVSDYDIVNIARDEDGNREEVIDYSWCNLERAVCDQIVLPQDAWGCIPPNNERNKKYISDLQGWSIDDFVVNLEQ